VTAGRAKRKDFLNVVSIFSKMFWNWSHFYLYIL